MIVPQSIAESAREAAFQEAAEANNRRDEEMTASSLKLKKGACEPSREHLRRSRKPRMRTVEHFLCDYCDSQISKPEDGFVIHGNIYVADPKKTGGLIGNNFPDDGEPVTQDNVTKTVMCRHCFMKALGLLEKSGFNRRTGSVTEQLRNSTR